MKCSHLLEKCSHSLIKCLHRLTKCSDPLTQNVSHHFPNAGLCSVRACEYHANLACMRIELETNSDSFRSTELKQQQIERGEAMPPPYPSSCGKPKKIARPTSAPPPGSSSRRRSWRRATPRPCTPRGGWRPGPASACARG
jgi:hypothetical protein